MVRTLFLSAQDAPWEFIAGGGPDTSAAITFEEGRTDIAVSAGFYFDADELTQPSRYDTSEYKFIAAADDLVSGRLGFSYRLPDTTDFVEFELLLDVGTGIDPVKVGCYSESRQDTWRNPNPEFTFFAGDSVAARGAILYIEVLQGTVELANFDLLSWLEHDDDANSGATVINDLSDVTLSPLSSGDVLRWNGTDFENVQAYTYDLIWAEENGGIANNTREYSFGNSATGNDNFGIPIWQDMEIVGMVVNAETSGTSASFTCTLDAVDIPQQITATSTTTVTYFPSAVSATQGQLLNFKTLTITGTWTDVRVGAIVKQKILFE